jgi:hypothetical protein
LDCHNFASVEATGVVNVMAFFLSQEPFMAILCDNVLLNGSAAHVDLHVSHDDLISGVSSRGDELLQLRSSLLQSESVGLVGNFLREFDVGKEA